MTSTSRSSKSPGARPTIIDVARVAGVSKSLVSLVLQGDSSVSAVRRKAVQDAIDELNYRPSHFARGLASSSTRSVGVLITDYRNLSFTSVLAGLREVLDEAGYRIIISDLHQSPHNNDDPVATFSSMHVDALVMFAEPRNLKTSGLPFPVEVIGEWEKGVSGSDIIFSDDAVGTSLVLEHLSSLGHTAIVHLSGRGGIARNRRIAYETQMGERGLTPLVFGIDEPTDEIGGYRATRELLESGATFTAIYAANDTIAAGAISALRERGLEVPRDVSIVGYDNSPMAADFMFKLTSVDDMGLAIGHRAAERILERLAATPGSAAGKPAKILLEPNLVVRQSTLPLKRK